MRFRYGSFTDLKGSYCKRPILEAVESSPSFSGEGRIIRSECGTMEGIIERRASYFHGFLEIKRVSSGISLILRYLRFHESCIRSRIVSPRKKTQLKLSPAKLWPFCSNFRVWGTAVWKLSKLKCCCASVSYGTASIDSQRVCVWCFIEVI